jgi:hypothetical protein
MNIILCLHVQEYAPVTWSSEMYFRVLLKHRLYVSSYDAVDKYDVARNNYIFHNIGRTLNFQIIRVCVTKMNSSFKSLHIQKLFSKH